MSELARDLAPTAGAVRLLARETAANILRMGHHLLNARHLLGPQFPAWVRTQFAWTPHDIARMIRVAQAFAAVPTTTLDRMDATALCLLAERNAPPGARTAALEAAAAGRTVTVAHAHALVAAARGTVRPTAVPKLAEGIDRRQSHEHDPSVPLGWKAIEQLAELGGVRVSRVPDWDEGDDAARPWCVRFTPAVGEPIDVVSKDSLAAALTAAAGTQPTRGCNLCGRIAPAFDGYSRKPGNPLGRSFTCRRCETKRVGDAKKIKRGTSPVADQNRPATGRTPADGATKGSPASPPAARRDPPAG